MINEYIHSLHIPNVAISQLFLSFLFSGCAFYLFLSKGNRRTGLCLLVLAGVMLRLYAASDLYLHPWDERYHALVGKNLLNHLLKPTLYETPALPYNHENWTDSHIWLHKPPLSLWTIAGSIAAFGNTEIAVRLPSVILSSLSILLIYGVGVMLVDPRTAFLAAFLFSWSSPVLELVGGRAPLDHVDTMMLAFVLAGVWCAGAQVQSGKTYLLGLLGLITGLAILTKSLPSLIVPSIWLIWALCEGKSGFKTIGGLLVVVSIAFLVAAPWHFYIHQQYPSEAAWESRYILRHLFETLEGHTHRWSYYFSKMGRNFSEIVVVVQSD